MRRGEDAFLYACGLIMAGAMCYLVWFFTVYTR